MATLQEIGFIPVETQDARELRVTLERAGWRALGRSPAVPWWTVQRLRGKSVEWFVDFPPLVPTEAIVSFVETVEALG